MTLPHSKTLRDLTLRDVYVSTLQTENAGLRARIAQLEQEIGLRIEVPLIFGLTEGEGKIVALLMGREIATKETLLVAVTRDPTGNVVPEIKIVDVYICKARAKLKKFGIGIETVWGRGYRIDQESKALINQYRGHGTQVAQAG